MSSTRACLVDTLEFDHQEADGKLVALIANSNITANETVMVRFHLVSDIKSFAFFLPKIFNVKL